MEHHIVLVEFPKIEHHIVLIECPKIEHHIVLIEFPKLMHHIEVPKIEHRTVLIKKKHSTSEKNKMESTKIVSNKCHRIWNPDSITEGNKHSTLILANVNRQANTVKDLKQN